MKELLNVNFPRHIKILQHLSKHCLFRHPEIKVTGLDSYLFLLIFRSSIVSSEMISVRLERVNEKCFGKSTIERSLFTSDRFSPWRCFDSFMPRFVALHGKTY